MFTPSNPALVKPHQQASLFLNAATCWLSLLGFDDQQHDPADQCDRSEDRWQQDMFGLVGSHFEWADTVLLSGRVTDVMGSERHDA